MYWRERQSTHIFGGHRSLRGPREDGGHGRPLRVDGLYPSEQFAEAPNQIYVVASPFRGRLLCGIWALFRPQDQEVQTNLVCRPIYRYKWDARI
jgi:hypothetical protein